VFVLRIDYKSGQAFTFCFRTEDGANDAAAAIIDAKPGALVPILDDHGHNGSLFKTDVLAMMLTDLVKEEIGRKEINGLMAMMNPQIQQAPAFYSSEQGEQGSAPPRRQPVDTANVDPRFAALPGVGATPFAS
jgi:hypothetical protein